MFSRKVAKKASFSKIVEIQEAVRSYLRKVHNRQSSKGYNDFSDMAEGFLRRKRYANDRTMNEAAFCKELLGGVDMRQQLLRLPRAGLNE